MNKAIVALLAGFFLASTAAARIGETREECIARYGQPLGEDEKQTAFLKSGIAIGITFFQGKADLILYSKAPGKGLVAAKDKLSKVEIAALMKANFPGNWEEGAAEGIHQQFHSENGELIAQTDMATGNLVICTKGYAQRDAAAKKAKEEEKLKGF